MGRVRPWGAAAIAMLVGAFVLDLQTPLGVADWWAYILSIIAGLVWRGPTAAAVIAVPAIVLTLLGGVLSEGADSSAGWINRGIGCMTIVIVGGLCWGLGSKAEALAESEAELRASIAHREEMTRDLHDGILQRIYAVWLKLVVAKTDLGERAKDGADVVANASNELNRAIRELRALIYGTELAEVSSTGEPQLATELQLLVSEIAKESVPECRLDVDEQAAAAVAGRHARELVLIVREAISNTVRHASARSGALSLRRSDTTIALEWRDDGVGFREPNPHGRGLANMRARAHRIGADLTVTSAPGDGVTLVVTLPSEPAKKQSAAPAGASTAGTTRS
ncbi:MAG: sensor histidine kinase [Kofleriaceae bacterium]